MPRAASDRAVIGGASDPPGRRNPPREKATPGMEPGVHRRWRDVDRGGALR